MREEIKSSFVKLKGRCRIRYHFGPRIFLMKFNFVICVWYGRKGPNIICFIDDRDFPDFIFSMERENYCRIYLNNGWNIYNPIHNRQLMNARWCAFRKNNQNRRVGWPGLRIQGSLSNGLTWLCWHNFPHSIFNPQCGKDLPGSNLLPPYEYITS